ncbi:MAG: 2-iminoacetate synthase ThiH [Sulfurospirillaceae bacterium]|nr:2-iminoacetate synthase ThiH [Sulfurospirillaceae bacterium]
MSFLEKLKEYEEFDLDSYFENVTDEMILESIYKTTLDKYDFLNILAPQAKKFLEKIAQRAHDVTVQNFGYTINLYLPMYVSNYCSSNCLYCGFSKQNRIQRSKLTLEEVEAEAQEIAKTGIKHILFLTGESKKITPLEYLIDVTKILKKYFSLVAIEIAPMSEEEYKQLFDAGVNGLTIYQEVYDREIYGQVHISGEKTNYDYRLDAPERGAKAGFRNVNIGALFGLGNIQKEAFISGLHAKYLSDKYLECELGLSLPRINEAEGGFQPYTLLDDATFVQIMCAYRLFLPRVEINISTREKAEFRNNLLKICATKFSAGSRTEVGGYTKARTEPQFEISDVRDSKDVIDKITAMGYEPVYKNWENIS